MDLSNYEDKAIELSLKHKDKTFYVIYNESGDWAFVEDHEIEDEDNGFRVYKSFKNGEEI